MKKLTVFFGTIVFLMVVGVAICDGIGNSQKVAQIVEGGGPMGVVVGVNDRPM